MSNKFFHLLRSLYLLLLSLLLLLCHRTRLSFVYEGLDTVKTDNRLSFAVLRFLFHFCKTRERDKNECTWDSIASMTHETFDKGRDNVLFFIIILGE